MTVGDGSRFTVSGATSPLPQLWSMIAHAHYGRGGRARAA